MLVVAPHKSGKWIWYYSGSSFEHAFDKKKDAVAAAKSEAKRVVRKQIQRWGRSRVEPVFIEIHYKGKSKPRTISITEDDV